MKGYSYIEKRQGTYCKRVYEYNEETCCDDVYEVIYTNTLTIKWRVIENITMGRAKRIARNSSFNWTPWRCGIGFRKLKDKKYKAGGCSFLYNSRTRRLTTRIPYSKIQIISKVLITEK